MSETEESTKLGAFPPSSSSCIPHCLLRVVDGAPLHRPAAAIQANAFHVSAWTLAPPLLMKETLRSVTPSTFIIIIMTDRQARHGSLLPSDASQRPPGDFIHISL